MVDAFVDTISLLALALKRASSACVSHILTGTAMHTDRYVVKEWGYELKDSERL